MERKVSGFFSVFGVYFFKMSVTLLTFHTLRQVGISIQFTVSGLALCFVDKCAMFLFNLTYLGLPQKL